LAREQVPISGNRYSRCGRLFHAAYEQIYYLPLMPRPYLCASLLEAPD
jgi:hypothetical protein